jgi:GTP-binding protein
MTTVVEAQFLAAVSPGGAFLPPTLPEVAFAGRSNVGKSSLINTLTGRKSLARTSSTPGCTRSINFFHIRAADGLNFQLVDLPGYGYAKRSKAERAAWGPLLERYLLERAPLRAVILLVDVRRGLEEEEQDLLEFMRQPGHATRPLPGIVLVATKIDKLPLSQRQSALAKLKRAGVGAIGFSSVTRDGVDDLWKRLRFHLLGGDELAATPEHAQAAQGDATVGRAAAPSLGASKREEAAKRAPEGRGEGDVSSDALEGHREGDASPGPTEQGRDERHGAPRAAERSAPSRPNDRKASPRPAGRSKSRSGAPRPANRHKVRNASPPAAERREGANAPAGGSARAPSSPEGRKGEAQPGRGPSSPQQAGVSGGKGASNGSRKSSR